MEEPKKIDFAKFKLPEPPATGEAFIEFGPPPGSHRHITVNHDSGAVSEYFTKDGKKPVGPLQFSCKFTGFLR